MDKVAVALSLSRSVADCLIVCVCVCVCCLSSVPVIPVSSLTGQGLKSLAPTVVSLHRRWDERLSTARLNRWLERFVSDKPHPNNAGRAVKIKFMAQTSTRPPTFQLTVSRAKFVSEVCLSRFVAPAHQRAHTQHW